MKANFFAKDIISSLSPLEASIITAVKLNKKYRTKDIYMLFKRKASRSSIPVIMDRLYKKGLLNREVEHAKGGARFVYVLTQNKEKFERTLVDNIVGTVTRRFGSKALVYFDESLEKRGRK